MLIVIYINFFRKKKTTRDCIGKLASFLLILIFPHLNFIFIHKNIVSYIFEIIKIAIFHEHALCKNLRSQNYIRLIGLTG